MATHLSMTAASVSAHCYHVKPFFSLNVIKETFAQYRACDLFEHTHTRAFVAFIVSAVSKQGIRLHVAHSISLFHFLGHMHPLLSFYFLRI